MFAGMIARPRATSDRTNSADSPSRAAMKAISGVTSPHRAYLSWVPTTPPPRRAASHGSRSRGRPSLHELAVASGIPGKMDVAGSDVLDLWQAGRIDQIVAYNECDAITTYLLWLRVAYFGGFFNSKQYEAEQESVRELLSRESQRPGREHLQKYLEAWKQLAGNHARRGAQMGLGI